MEKRSLTVAIVGVGLIGGSMALDLKKNKYCSKIIGVDNNPENIKQALALGIIDQIISIEEVVSEAEVIIVATPVDTTKGLLSTLLDQAKQNNIIIDVGSIKAPICEHVKSHKNRGQYVACHPIAGTEFSGPDAAHHSLFKGKVNIICNEGESNKQAVKTIISLFDSLGSTSIFMDAFSHDQHITYVSHLSHITSFALSLTVQELEKANQNIYNMAGSGFTSTVRLAKSSAKMWVPIFMENKQNMVQAIDDYIIKLQLLKEQILSNETNQLEHEITLANSISRVIEK